MEHLLPRRYFRESLKVPFFGLGIYDNLGFASYPDRRGWDRDIMDLRSPNYGGRSAFEAASFAQEWLYFGCLSEVTGIPVRGTNFIRVGNDGRLLITSERLHFYLDRWRQEVMEEENESRQKRSFRRAKFCLEFVIMCIYTTNYLLVPEHPEVAISIDMLLISLLRTFTTIYGPQSWDDTPSFFFETKFRWWVPGSNPQIIRHLKTQMALQGWCQYRLESFGNVLTTDCLYIISLLGTDDLLEGHSSCSRSMCIGNQIDESTYNDTPRHALQGCSCDFVHVDLSEAVKIIEQGYIPLATISISMDNELRLDLRPYEPGMSYIAISHVWSHGLGNPSENALRKCQLQRLQRLLNGCRGHSESATVYFWLDTLCLPLRPAFWRKMAMRQMRQCYLEASAVLVLDRHLQQSTLQSSAAELLLHIGISDWRFRVWTLQEGFFARKLMFQFLETAVDAEELWDDYAPSVSAGMSNGVDIFITVQVAPALGIELYERGRRLTRHTKKFSIASLATSLRGRAISKPEDEPLCAASLLGQDQTLSTLLESPKKDRMKTFWRSQHLIPSWVAFVDGPRLTEAGYQWAPSSLCWPNLIIPMTSDHGTLLPDGLQITKSGFVLLNNELVEAGTTNRVIGLVDETGSRHYFMRSFDELNPPFPALHDDTTLAVVVLEWSKSYEPQALVAVIIDEGPNIHCRGVCRGIIGPESMFPKEVFTGRPVGVYKARKTRDDQKWILQ